MSRPHKAAHPDDSPGRRNDPAPPPRWSGHPLRILQQLKAGRQVERLKQARNLTPAELATAKEELLAFGPSSIPPLIECLSHGEARGPAIEVLEKLAGKETLRTYVEALMSRNPAVVSGITKALEKSKALDPHLLLEYLADPSVPKAALDAILTAHFPALDRRRLIDLLPVLGKEGRAVVFRLLEKNLDQTTVLRLLTLLSHPDWSLRVFAARLLAQSPTRPPIEKLTALLADEHKTVRLEAVKALERAKAREAVPALAELLRDPDLKVQTACIDALISLSDVSAVPALLDVLKDESEYARRAAVEVLNQVATTEAIQDLVRALRDADWWVRVRAADALGALGGEKVVDAVVGLLGDGDDFVRRYAVEILNSVPSERAVAPLIAALDDADWWVRERSIDALGKTRDPRAVEPLVDLLQRESGLAPLCIRALSEIGDRQALDGLADLVDSDRSEVRRVAVDALRTFSAANLSAEERTILHQALTRAGVSGAAGIPMRIGDPKKGFGPEAGRSTPTPAPAPAPRAIAGAGGTGGSGATPPPTPAFHSMLDSPAEPGGAPEATKFDGPALPPRPINFYDLAPESLLLNRYRVLRTIGKGGFGVVYLVHDAAIQDEVILKVLNPQLSIDELAIRRFVRELKLTRRITHKNVIRIHDLLDIGGAKAVSMEYFPGRDLGKILKHESAIAGGAGAVRIAAQIARRARRRPQRAGVIHRDIKPANILVGKDDAIKIVDFGLASARQHIGSRLTKSGLLIGTPEYMAPEQISGNTIDPRTDIYSVGVLMYEMLAGRKPFIGETAVQVLFQHLEGAASRSAKSAPISPRSSWRSSIGRWPGTPQIAIRPPRSSRSRSARSFPFSPPDPTPAWLGSTPSSSSAGSRAAPTSTSRSACRRSSASTASSRRSSTGRLTAEETEALLSRDPHREPPPVPHDARLGGHVLLGGRARTVPDQRLPQAFGLGRRVPRPAAGDAEARRSRTAERRARVHEPHLGPGARDRQHRVRQVDDARRHDRRDQRAAAIHHRHHRGSGRVRARVQAMPGRPARGGHRRPFLRRRAALGAPAGSGRDHGRRAPGSGVDRPRHGGVRDRAPRPRHPPHARRASDDPSHRRCLPLRGAEPGSPYARRQPAGGRQPGARAGRPTGAGGAPWPRSWW